MVSSFTFCALSICMQSLLTIGASALEIFTIDDIIYLAVGSATDTRYVSNSVLHNCNYYDNTVL